MNAPRSSGDFDTRVRIEDLDPRRPTFVATPWGAFALYLDSRGTLHALDAFCPHMDGPLFQGSIAADVVVCPWHQWRFSLETGACLFPRDGARRLRRCPVRLGPAGTYLLCAPEDGSPPAPPVEIE